MYCQLKVYPSDGRSVVFKVPAVNENTPAVIPKASGNANGAAISVQTTDAIDSPKAKIATKWI